ncbi:MAG: hypothetical protein D3904_08595 [Candidatus Electrothrix sp. EH2]|nr:hypothetical protein [Candidatus Electrothrix sp. EH2]
MGDINIGNAQNNNIVGGDLHGNVSMRNITSDFSEQISSLRKEITKFVQSAAEKKEALEVIDEIEKKLASQSPSKKVIDSLLRALPDVGSVASIASLILSVIK